MTGYKVYLTRSREVASLIAEALKPNTSEVSCICVGFGKVSEQDFIPAIYHNSEYFYARIKYDGLNYPLYELHFA